MFRAYFGLVRKEFIQISRDPNMLRMILAMPVIQLLLLGYAVNTDVKRLATDVYDYDQSQQSREFVRSFSAGDYFVPTNRVPAADATALWRLDERFEAGDAEVALIIPPGFSEKLTASEHVTVGIVTDGADANAARAGMGYAVQIVGTFSAQRTGQAAPVDVRYKFLYNSELESVYFMIPGIVATLLTMVTVMLTSMAIVREREMGTLEQLSVTPIGPRTLLFGKISTFAILGLLEMCIALVFGVLWFGIPFVGSPLLLFALSGLYLLTTLGIGMFFSTVTSTQQQAMFFAWFFSVFAMITSGFFTPVSNMPQWLQYVTLANPMRFFMEIVRGIMMKGSGIADLAHEILALAIFGVTVFSLAALRFRKRTA
jgi:ABC-2 type transport system permease protein